MRDPPRSASLTIRLSKPSKPLPLQGHLSLSLPLSHLTSRPSTQQPPFPKDSILEPTLQAPSTVACGPSRSQSFAAPAPPLTPNSSSPASAPQTPLSLGSAPAHLCSPSGAPPTQLRVGVRAVVGVPGSPGLAGVKRLERRRRSPGRRAGAEAGAVAAARRHRHGLPRSRRQPLESEPELLREEGPYRREAELTGGGGAQTGRVAGLQLGGGKENRSKEIRERMRQAQGQSGKYKWLVELGWVYGTIKWGLGTRRNYLIPLEGASSSARANVQ